MKISKLGKLAGVFFALALGTSTVFAQGYRVQNNKNLSPGNTCINRISNLTKDQISKIQELEKSHLESMEQLRNDRRSTSNTEEKNKIRSEMLKQRDQHRSEVKGLLTESQQKEYNSFHLRENNLRQNSREFRQGGGFHRGFENGGQQITRGSRGVCQRQSSGIRNRNGQNFRECPNNHRRGRGNGYRNRISNS